MREIFRLYLERGGVGELKQELDRRGWKTPTRQASRAGGDRPFTRGHLYRMLGNAIYIRQIVHKGVVHPGLHPGIVGAEVWEAVRAQLAENLNGHRHQTNAEEPSLLTGLAFDAQGMRLKPSHATKGAKRYRYYFRAADQAGGGDGDGKGDARTEGPRRALRIPAQELESAVISALTKFLCDASGLMQHLDGIDAGRVQRRLQDAAALAARLESAPAAERIEILQRLVVRIVVTAQQLKIAVRTAALGGPADAGLNDEATVSIVVPVQLKRCGLGVRLIVKGPQEDRARGPNSRLVMLLARAQRWFGMLRSGQSPSVLAIAQEHRLATKEVTRVIYLAFLAPDIVQCIVRGKQPMGLGVKQLRAAAPLPMDWSEQRRRLGFAA